jgi:hypothetical protein
MRPVEPLVVSPSEDLALVAQRFAHRMPRLVRHLLDGLGRPDAESADLLSYLLFDGAYTRTLVEIGYRDAAARIDEIEAFLREPVRAPAPTREERDGGTGRPPLAVTAAVLAGSPRRGPGEPASAPAAQREARRAISRPLYTPAIAANSQSFSSIRGG